MPPSLSASSSFERAPSPLVTITTRAPFASLPASARVSRSGPRTFTAQMSRGDPVYTPALLTRTSSGSFTRAASEAMESGSETSSRSARPPPGALSGSRTARMTSWSFARSRATASPIPRDAPVTRAVGMTRSMPRWPLRCQARCESAASARASVCIARTWRGTHPGPAVGRLLRNR